MRVQIGTARMSECALRSPLPSLSSYTTAADGGADGITRDAPSAITNADPQPRIGAGSGQGSLLRKRGPPVEKETRDGATGRTGESETRRQGADENGERRQRAASSEQGATGRGQQTELLAGRGQLAAGSRRRAARTDEKGVRGYDGSTVRRQGAGGESSWQQAAGSRPNF